MFRLAVIVAILSYGTTRALGSCLGQCPNGIDFYSLPHKNCAQWCLCDHGVEIVMDCAPGFHYSVRDRRCTYAKEAGCTLRGEFIEKIYRKAERREDDKHYYYGWSSPEELHPPSYGFLTPVYPYPPISPCGVQPPCQTPTPIYPPHPCETKPPCPKPTPPCGTPPPIYPTTHPSWGTSTSRPSTTSRPTPWTTSQRPSTPSTHHWSTSSAKPRPTPWTTSQRPSTPSTHHWSTTSATSRPTHVASTSVWLTPSSTPPTSSFDLSSKDYTSA